MVEASDEKKNRDKAARLRFQEALVKTVEHLLRFGALTNAGGATASIAVLGATARNGVLNGWLLIPLLCFVIGIIASWLLVLETMYKTMQTIAELSDDKDESEPRGPIADFQSWLRASVHEDVFIIAPFVCFVASVMFGLILVIVN